MRRVSSSDPRSTADSVSVLSAGGVAVFPTDTLYGFSAAISSREAAARIAAMKRHASTRPFLYLASSAAMVDDHIESWGCARRAHLESVWPAPLTAVFVAGRRCPEWVGRTIALRVPKDAWLRGVIEQLGEPVVSTSVNRAGEAPMGDADGIDRVFGEDVELIVVRENMPRDAEPSTLVDFTGSAPAVIRAGAYPWATDGNPSN